MSIFLRSRVNWTDGPTEIKCDGRRIASFPNCFQKKGLTGEVAKALCSTSSITILAMTAETGEPIAVPKTC